MLTRLLYKIIRTKFVSSVTHIVLHWDEFKNEKKFHLNILNLEINKKLRSQAGIKWSIKNLDSKIIEELVLVTKSSV